MNERIKELAVQADEYADYKLQMPGEYDPDWHDVRDEKFAELIVRECAEFVRYKAEKAMSQEILYVGNDLLEHFGVE